MVHSAGTHFCCDNFASCSWFLIHFLDWVLPDTGYLAFLSDCEQKPESLPNHADYLIQSYSNISISVQVHNTSLLIKLKVETTTCHTLKKHCFPPTNLEYSVADIERVIFHIGRIIFFLIWFNSTTEKTWHQTRRDTGLRLNQDKPGEPLHT
jgi:hypothetical protein